MRYTETIFNIGSYRPIYLWAGPGTIRMNRLKFMGVPVDQAVHQNAHALSGAVTVLRDLYCNWVHLTYNWGFPPEVEQEDWQSFAQAAEVYHAQGSSVFAYIQTSNCVFTGSFRAKDWYAVDQYGRRITYFTYGGRYMACFTSESWEAHLKALIAGALERGADGIFLDNLFHGGQPLSLLGAWLGSTGCYCSRCRTLYREVSQQEIPEDLQLSLENTTSYLRWRSELVSGLVGRLAAYVHRLKPGAPVSANDFDPVLRNSYLVYGIDLEQLAAAQDVTMIENFGLPAWSAEAERGRLANNALTIRTARAQVRGRAHLSVLSYDVGIGFDGVYPVRRYLQGIAEACALGVSMTTKGTEYFDGRQMTLLTDAQYAVIHQAVGGYQRWIESQSHRFSGDRINLAPVGLLFPGEALWLHWFDLAPLYFGAGQALTAAGIPWKVLQPGENPTGLSALLTFVQPEPAVEVAGIQVVHVPSLPGWQAPPGNWWVRGKKRRSLIGKFTCSLMQAYSAHKLIRGLADNFGLQKIITQSPFYYLPEPAQRDRLLQALPVGKLFPRVVSSQPVLIETWQAGTWTQVHLVNYAATPQSIELYLEKDHVVVENISPDKGGRVPEMLTSIGEPVRLDLDIYQILVCSRQAQHDEDHLKPAC